VILQEEPLGEDDLRVLQKDRVKKDNHNIIERRRRFNINDRIKELGTLLPRQNEQYYEIVRDVRQNKGSILKASVDYIKLLRRDKERRNGMEEKYKKLEQSNRRALLKLQDYEQRMTMAGLSVEQTTWRPATATEIDTLRGEVATTRLQSREDPSKSPIPMVLMEDDSPISRDPMSSILPQLNSVPSPDSPLSTGSSQDDMET